MKRIHSLTLVVGLILLLSAVLWTGRAAASTGCFSDTNGHWAETFICWLKDNDVASGYWDGTFRPGNPISRAEAAVLVQKSANIPPASGQIIIEADVTSWNYTNPAAPITRNLGQIGYITFQRSEMGYNYLRISPTIPVAFYGKLLEFIGFEICYIGSADAYLSDIYVYTNLQTNTPAGYNTLIFSDDTDRAEATCRYYALPSPALMTPEISGIYIRSGVSWTVVNSWFYIGRTTLVFQPTGTNAVSPSGNLSQGNVGDLFQTDPFNQSPFDIQP